MKRARKCGECGSDNLYMARVDARGSYGPNLLPGVGSLWSGSKLELWVCRECGRVQMYVPEESLPQLERKFKRVLG